MTASVVLICAGVVAAVAAGVAHGRNGILVLIITLPGALISRRCFAGIRTARLLTVIWCAFIVGQAIVFAPPLLRSAVAADRGYGLVDIGIAAIYAVAGLLLWVPASNAHFDADPHAAGPSRSGQPDTPSPPGTDGP